MSTRIDTMVGVWVFRNRGGTWEALQLLRSPGRYMAGTWQIVSGGIEPGEEAWRAALRELHEETGLLPIAFFNAGQVDTFYIAAADVLWHRVNFVALVGDGVVTLNDEHDAHRWLDLGAFEDAIMWASERPVLATIRRDILGDGPSKPHLRLELPDTVE